MYVSDEHDHNVDNDDELYHFHNDPNHENHDFNNYNH
jgi:hypothetical protein